MNKSLSYKMEFGLVLLSLAFLFAGWAAKTPRENKWEDLFNGRNLEGWDSWLGVPFDSAGRAMKADAIGLNKDPRHVFAVVKDAGGENLIRISGEQFGALISKREYADFHLQLQFKWGDTTWPPKKGRKKDSGLLYFGVGELGGDNGFWLRSQEFQIEQGNVGDYWGVSDASEDIPADKINDSTYTYDPKGSIYTFSAHAAPGRHCIKSGDAERPAGEWNTLDLYCHGDTSVHVVNGKITMVLYHSQQWDNGVARQLTKGKLQIQSEGAEVFYKHIRIQSIDDLKGVLR